MPADFPRPRSSGDFIPTRSRKSEDTAVDKRPSEHRTLPPKTMLRKILNVAITVIAVAIVLPIPLAIWVDMTYHWLLLITLPIGIPLLAGLLLWRVLLDGKTTE